MPVGESPQGGFPLRPAAAGVLLALVLGLGCLNLDLPTVPPTPPAPSLDILTPKAGDVINLTAQVSVAAASVEGIYQVNVLCGPPDGGAHVVYTWAAAPYQALVDFTLCQDVTQPNPDAGHPLLQVQVTAVSGGDAGATQQKDVSVFLDADGPLLTVLYPPAAQPLAPFTVLVATDAGLRSFPQVLLDGLPATSVTVGNGASGLVTYSVFFQSTPGLGTDNYPYTPGVPVPIEVLTDTQRAVRLTVSATGQNGNTTQVDLAVELTRVVWDRYIPGQPAASGPLSWASQPVAVADAGLLLPLATAAPASSTSAWIPGRLDAVDGTFYAFDPLLLPPDAGFLAKGLNALGQTLFVQPQGLTTNLLLAPPPPDFSALLPGTLSGQTVAAPLAQVDSDVCLQDTATACSDAGDSVTCVTPQLLSVTASGLGRTGPPAPGVVAGGGGRYLSPNNGLSTCAGSASWNLADLDSGTVSFGPTVDPNADGGPCTVQAVSKLLAVGDGTFVVQLTSSCGVTAVLPPEFPILRVGANSAILGAYTAPLGTPATTAHEVVGVLADGRVVTLVNAPPYTNFELWSRNASTPDVVTSIAGLYDSADAVLTSVLAQNSYAYTDGSFAVLLSGTSSFGAAIAAFGPNLQPRWLYLYPRIANAGTARLVSAPTAGNIYLVDLANNRAVSLQVVPPPPPPPPPTAPPAITSFQATPASLGPDGGTVTLSWNVSGAAGLSIAPGIGPVPAQAIGSVQTDAQASTTYTLTASNALGTVSKTASVCVVTGPVTLAVSGPATYTACGMTFMAQLTLTNGSCQPVQVTAATVAPAPGSCNFNGTYAVAATVDAGQSETVFNLTDGTICCGTAPCNLTGPCTTVWSVATSAGSISAADDSFTLNISPCNYACP